MELDLLLASQLQAEEDHRAAAAQQQGEGSEEAAFSAKLQSGVQTVLKYEDELVQAMCLSCMPLEELKQAAGPEQDALAHELLQWFKHHFFTWVNSPKCSRCGSDNTQASGATHPSAEEQADSAGRCELHQCHSCGHITRFPRYNDPVKLLETRSGRCGEWANCFTLCCRSAGLDVRYILDATDHVWTEYYSDAQQRWIHLDPCEAAYDQPLLYEEGWGKKLTYVMAFHRMGVVDVSRRYSKQDLSSRRTQISETQLHGACRQLTERLRRGIPAGDVATLRQRDTKEQDELEGRQHHGVIEEEQRLPGRQTGSEAWRAARGELGMEQPLSPAQEVDDAQVAAQGMSSQEAAQAAAACTDNTGTATAPQKDVGMPQGAGLVKQTKKLDLAGARPEKDWNQPTFLGTAPDVTPATTQLARRNSSVPPAPVKAGMLSQSLSPAAQLNIGSPQQAPAKANPQDAMALRIREEFARIMAGGTMSPNEAAFEAVSCVKAAAAPS